MVGDCCQNKKCAINAWENHTCCSSSSAPRSTPPSSKSCRDASHTSLMTLAYTSGCEEFCQQRWSYIENETELFVLPATQLLSLGSYSTYHWTLRHSWSVSFCALRSTQSEEDIRGTSRRIVAPIRSKMRPRCRPGSGITSDNAWKTMRKCSMGSSELVLLSAQILCESMNVVKKCKMIPVPGAGVECGGWCNMEQYRLGV